jgi:hypothetical protein
MTALNIPSLSVEKITNAALTLMAKTASNLEPGEKFAPADIVAAIVSDPAGETAHYLANLIATGIGHYQLFAEMANEH